MGDGSQYLKKNAGGGLCCGTSCSAHLLQRHRQGCVELKEVNFSVSMPHTYIYTVYIYIHMFYWCVGCMDYIGLGA